MTPAKSEIAQKGLTVYRFLLLILQVKQSDMNELEKELLSVEEIQKICFERNIPFYTYRLPGDHDLCFGAQLHGDPEPFSGFLPRMTGGFVLAPFTESERYPALYIAGEFTFRNRLTNRAECERLSIMRPHRPDPDRPDPDMSRQEYTERLNPVIARLKKGQLDKVVFSRTVVRQIAGRQSAPTLFHKIEKAYPDAFVFLVHIPGYGTWAGASPETFVQLRPDGLHSMSLAGTQPVTADSSAEGLFWSRKEVEEQAIVTDYIRTIFQTTCTGPITENGPFTRQAATVYHLCTTFSCRNKQSCEQLNQLINRLHPSPAICGLPKAEALQLIASTEPTARKYYGGFLGPVDHEESFRLFVNLRSMEIFDNAVQLHVGGGITAQSNADQEWDETCDKAATLLKIIEV